MAINLKYAKIDYTSRHWIVKSKLKKYLWVIQIKILIKFGVGLIKNRCLEELRLIYLS